MLGFNEVLESNRLAKVDLHKILCVLHILYTHARIEIRGELQLAIALGPVDIKKLSKGLSSRKKIDSLTMTSYSLIWYMYVQKQLTFVYLAPIGQCQFQSPANIGFVS